jgi:heme exporter protein CcmD
MDTRYAIYIWLSFGSAAVAVLWNVLAPTLARRQLRRRWLQAAQEAGEIAKTDDQEPAP